MLVEVVAAGTLKTGDGPLRPCSLGPRPAGFASRFSLLVALADAVASGGAGRCHGGRARPGLVGVSRGRGGVVAAAGDEAELSRRALESWRTSCCEVAELRRSWLRSAAALPRSSAAFCADDGVAGSISPPQRGCSLHATATAAGRS